MSHLFTELSKKLSHYFNSWQLTVAFVFLSMQILMQFFGRQNPSKINIYQAITQNKLNRLITLRRS
jgi:hypothetical protein